MYCYASLIILEYKQLNLDSGYLLFLNEIDVFYPHFTNILKIIENISPNSAVSTCLLNNNKLAYLNY